MASNPRRGSVPSVPADAIAKMENIMTANTNHNPAFRAPSAASRRLGLAALACCALGASLTANAAAQELRMEMVRPEAAAKHQARAGRTSDSDASAIGQIVQLEGTLSYTRGVGLTLDDTVIELGRLASVGLASATGLDRLPDPSELDGRSVTVFGRRVETGVQATLVIVHSDTDLSAMSTLRTPPPGIPSTEDPNVGELSDGVPR
jgi:hypothetical protein